MIIYSAIYNEMPWTPYFLRHLLDFDCPIVISEGASNSLQRNSERSWDGSWEIIQAFADRWKDRVTVHLHDYSLNTGNGRRARIFPREVVKMKVWNEAVDGEWILALSPDNFYMPEDIVKIKRIFTACADHHYTLLTGMRVFIYNFQTVITKAESYLCGPWHRLWPCIWRKNSKYVQIIGNELLFDRDNRCLVGSESQTLYSSSPHVVIHENIKQFHYKGVKPYYNRIQRYRNDNVIIKKFMNFFIDYNAGLFEKYDGEHPSILNDHPFRYVEDCRENPNITFNWEDFVHLVTKP